MSDPSLLLHPIYETALSPDAWEEVLPQISAAFRCHFGDVFARRLDWSRFQGLAHGLSESDYQHRFLGFWTKRNVWTERHPVRRSGEVVATTDFISRRELESSEMYAGYLRRRELHQGLRLSTWCGDGWINDISLIRSWSAGGFTAEERRLAEWLVPHLCRAVNMAYRMGPQAGLLDGAESLAALPGPALLVEAGGGVLRLNAAAEELVRAGDVLRLAGGKLLAGAASGAAGRLETALQRAGSSEAPTASALPVQRAGGRTMRLLFIPMRARRIWPLPADGAALVLAIETADQPMLTAEELSARFDLTPSETALALRLAGGATIASIAAETGRSANTVRSHLHRVMHKTQMRRQTDLVRLVLGQAPAGPAPLGEQPVHEVD